MELRSGEFPGYGTKLLMMFPKLSYHFCSRMLGMALFFSRMFLLVVGKNAFMFWCRSLFMAVLLGKIVSDPMPMYVK